MPRRAELRFLTGDRAGQVVTVEEGRTVLGRQVGDVVLPDKEVSSIHAIITYERGAWRVMDLGSTNGVWVNGQQVVESLLEVGTEIRIGQTVFQFADLPAEQSFSGDPSESAVGDATQPFRPGRRLTRSVVVGAPIDLGFGRSAAAPLDADTEEIPLNGAALDRRLDRRPAGYEVVLEILEGADQGLVYRFAADAILLGRLNTDLVVRDSDVSRRHAIIEVVSDQVLLRDLNSTNGTFVNGQRVGTARLRSGDRIKLGRCVLGFSLQLAAHSGRR